MANRNKFKIYLVKRFAMAEEDAHLVEEDVEDHEVSAPAIDVAGDLTDRESQGCGRAVCRRTAFREWLIGSRCGDKDS